MKIFVGDNEQAAVLAAAEDLQADLREVCGENLPIGSYGGYAEHPGFVICTVGVGDEPIIMARYGLDASWLKGKYESFIIEKKADRIFIVGADMLGTVFGVYHACEHFLGVDPLRFWTDMGVAKLSLKKVLSRAEQPVRWGPPAIRYRGWFINEDDLIRQFDYGDRKWDCDLSSTIRRHKSPYIVTNPAIYEGLIGTLLRLKQNLLLAGTYVCPRDTLWKEVMAMAARRGLYNTSQHFQPLGCWTASFDRYWAQRGQKQEYSWLNNRPALLEAWDAFAAEMSKFRPVWQVGYRGYDDSAFWDTEAGAPESMEGRAAVISEAIAAQVEIAKRYDRHPALTYFLWAEGDPLYRSGYLKLPEEVTVVFSDYGRTSIMKEGFWQYDGKGSRKCGVYYHLGFWSTGPTDNMGITPEKIDFNMRAAFQKGTTDYLLVNIASAREHLLGGCALAEISSEGIKGFDAGTHLEKWCGQRWGKRHAKKVAKLYRKYFDSLPRTPAPSKYPQFPKLLHDGCFNKLAGVTIDMMEAGEVSDKTYWTDAMAIQMLAGNLLNIIDEGQNQGFEETGPDKMYFQTVDEFLDYSIKTSEQMVADLAELGREVEKICKQIEPPDAKRFLRSHVAGQAVYMRILGQLAADVARAAQAMRQNKMPEAKKLLQEAHKNIDKGKANWHSKYKGRFQTWPIATLLVNFEGTQDRISRILKQMKAR